MQTTESKDVNRCIVRLRTEVWADTRGLHSKKSLLFMRRQCRGYNVLEEDTSAIGANEVFWNIVNLNECPDGLYEIAVCNERRDWESGHIDDYDYRLLPLSTLDPK